MSKIYKHSIKIVFAVVVGLLLAIPSVNAFSISPALVEISLDRGATNTGVISVASTEDHDASYEVSFQNFVAKGEEGQQDFVADNAIFNDIDWIVPQTGSITIEKGGRVDLSYVLTIPKDARPGGHYVAMFVSQKKESGEIGTGASIRSKIGVLFLIRVNGDIDEKLDIESFRVVQHENVLNRLPVLFETRFKNSGNVHLKPSGDIVIKNVFGRIAGVTPLNPRGSSVLSNSIRRTESEWTKGSEGVEAAGLLKEIVNEWKNFAIGPYTASIVGYYGESNHSLSGQIRFWVFPWHLILAAILLVAAMMVINGIYRRSLIRMVLKRSSKETKS